MVCVNYIIEKKIALSKKNILEFKRPTPKRTFNCHNHIGIELITRFRLGLSHPRGHKFKYNFLDCINTTCCCDKVIETTVHYLLHCPIFSDERSVFLKYIRTIAENVLIESDFRISETLLLSISFF